jgi:hypothetical protein
MKLDWTSVADISSSFCSRDADEVREALQERVDAWREYNEAVTERNNTPVEDRVDEEPPEEPSDEELTDDETDLLALLTEWSEECSEWRHGEYFIHESDFQDQMEELANECGYLGNPRDNPLMSCIDWEKWADMCRMDYTTYEAGDETFYARS